MSLAAAVNLNSNQSMSARRALWKLDPIRDGQRGSTRF
jgi:hypothetical protein